MTSNYESYKLPLGKYKNKTLSYVIHDVKDLKYLEWMCNTFINKDQKNKNLKDALIYVKNEYLD